MKGFILVLLISALGVIPVTAEWRGDLQNALTPGSDSDAGAVIEKIEKENPSWEEIAAFIREMEFEPPASVDTFQESFRRCTDDVDRPHILYVPPGYDGSSPMPLLVYLHGLVSRKEIMENREQYTRENPFIAQAREHGWLVLFPFAQLGAVWWDGVGMENIEGCIRGVKSRYNVDDNRVWMTGFSDGASASFLFAMTNPTDFAAFAPLNGHMGVGALDGEIPSYAANMKNTPLHVINTDLDALYPASTMRKMIDMAMDAGADITYREYMGIGHDFDYAEEELPVIRRFFLRHARDSFPPVIHWKTALPEFGRCMWLEIEAVSPEPPAPWHEDANLVLTDTRITFGFLMDREFQGEGVRVDGLSEGATVARAMDLREGDIIIAGNGMPVHNSDDLDSFKATLDRGDEFSVTVTREGNRLDLYGTLPEPMHYYLFPRSMPSAAIRAKHSGNRFDVECSRVERFSIYIHPDMIRPDQPLTIVVNGTTVFNGDVRPDIGFMVRNFLENRDRSQLYINKLTVDLSQF